MKLLKAQLKQIKHLEARINPDSEWVLRNRERLMSQIAHTSKQAVEISPVSPKVSHSFVTWTKIFVPRSLAHSFKPAFSVAVALVVTTAGWIASAYAEPGDMFWSAKSAFSSVIESGRLALASEEDQATLKLSYASKQAHILKQVIETENVDADKKAKLVEKTVNNFQKKFDSAQESIKTLDPVNASELVKEVSLSTRDISQTLKEASDAADKTDVALSLKIEQTATGATTQSLEMVGDTMAKKSEANLEISAEEKAIVKEHIDIAVEAIVADALKVVSSTAALGSSSTTIMLSTSSTIAEISTAIDEQKKTVNSLKETNLLEAINSTKILAEQVSVVINTQVLGKEGTTPVISTSTPSITIITTTSPRATTTTPTSTSSTSISTSSTKTSSSTP